MFNQTKRVVSFILSSWTGAIYWGTHFFDAKFHYLPNQQIQNCQRVLIYGSVNSNTFGHMFDDWTKFEVAACGNSIFLLNEDE